MHLSKRKKYRNRKFWAKKFKFERKRGIFLLQLLAQTVDYG